MTNYERFPLNIFEPTIKKYAFKEYDGTCQEKDYIIYPIRFDGLEDIYYFLKNNPHINKKVFDVLQSQSISKNSDKKGRTYEETLNSLIEDENFSLPEDYIRFSNYLSQMTLMEQKTKKRKYTYGGGMLDTRRLSRGDPNCYYHNNKIETQKSIQLNINIAYGAPINSKQAEHLAYFVLLIINGLQKNNYDINVNTIYLTNYLQEIIDININLKKMGEKLNIQELYKIVSNVDFNRRILFRIIETVEVKNEHWKCNYGTPCDRDKIFKIKNLKEDDIYIASPDKIGIRGNNLYDDIIRASESLNINNFLNIEELLEEQKILRK